MENRYALMTVDELATHLAKRLFPDAKTRCPFPNVDMSIADSTDTSVRELVEIATDSTGWYGIKEVDLGFNSTDVVLVADYYGGGCAQLAQIDQEFDSQGAEIRIKELILMTMCTENLTRDTVLIVDFEPEGD